jgi:hypothetical protein
MSFTDPGGQDETQAIGLIARTNEDFAAANRDSDEMSLESGELGDGKVLERLDEGERGAPDALVDGNTTLLALLRPAERALECGGQRHSQLSLSQAKADVAQAPVSPVATNVLCRGLPQKPK